jgi:spermidine/putrescine transport system permease protein
MATTAVETARTAPGIRARSARGLDHWFLPVFTALAIFYLLVPIFVMIVFSFNKPEGKFNYIWNQFSLEGWKHPFDWPGLGDAVTTSILIALWATLFSTILGTMIGLALTRYHFRGRGLLNGLIFLPMATPEIVMGSSLLALFVAAGFGGALGFGTILIAHIMFCISFVVVTVRARLAGMSDTLEQAAADLYATPSQTFWKVTFPLVFPGILGAALLAFSLSFDDFIVTNLNAGTTTTFPLYVWGVAQRGVPMQVNVVGTLMFVISITIVLVGEAANRRRNRVASEPVAAVEPVPLPAVPRS